MALGAHVVSRAAGVEMIRSRMFAHQLSLTGEPKAFLYHFVCLPWHIVDWLHFAIVC